MRLEHTEGDPRIFVFGSNLLGIHGAGAALYARRNLGAVNGVGEGMTGRAYALLTCSRPGIPLPIERVAENIRIFIRSAIQTRDVVYYVSEVGCGLAGFKAQDIAALFWQAPGNCELPWGWR